MGIFLFAMSFRKFALVYFSPLRTPQENNNVTIIPENFSVVPHTGRKKEFVALTLLSGLEWGQHSMLVVGLRSYWRQILEVKRTIYWNQGLQQAWPNLNITVGTTKKDLYYL